MSTLGLMQVNRGSTLFLACVASVSVWFPEQREIFGFGRARNETRPRPAYSRHFSRALAPRSLLRNRTETLATQATVFPSPLSEIPQLQKTLRIFKNFATSFLLSF